MILVTAGDTRSLAGWKSYLFIYFTLGVYLAMTAPFVLLIKHVKKECCSLSRVPSSTLWTCSWPWPTSSSFWWTVTGTNRCCVKLVSTNGYCCAAAMPWATKTTLCTPPCRGCLRGWLHRPCSQWHSGTWVGKRFLLYFNNVKVVLVLTGYGVVSALI